MMLNYRKRAIAAEAALATIANQAHLISMQRSGRQLTLTFMRNNALTRFTTYLTMDLDFERIEKELIGGQTDTHVRG